MKEGSTVTEALATITVTNEQIALIKKTIAQDATPAELELFFYDCRRNGVHPLDRMIHFTKRQGKYTPITSIDFMRTRASDTGEMAGSDDPVFEKDEDGKVLSASVTVYRITQGNRYPYTATARWGEYYPGDGNIGFMWRKMPHTMLGKCAEALALRKGFPKELKGLYAREEMDQAGETNAGPPNGAVKALTQEAEERDYKRAMARSTKGRRTDEEQKALGELQQAEEELDRNTPVETLFPTEEEDKERQALAKDATRLATKLKLKPEQREDFMSTYCGRGATLFNADLAAMAEMVDALRARAGEPKWGQA